MFITFEGLDGSGKSTIIAKLLEYINSKYPNLNYISTREPGGKDLKEAEKIRQLILDPENNIDPMTEAILFAASRRLHLENVIWPALEANKIIICDRYVDSSLAYQGAGQEIGVQKIKELNDIVTNSTYPDFTFLFDISAESSRQRLISQENHKDDRIEKSSLDFFKRAQDCYHQLAKENPHRFIIIDANQNVELVLAQVIQEFDKIIEKRK